MTRIVNENKLNEFMEVYEPVLVEMRTKYPHEYAWSADRIDYVVLKMRAALYAGSYSNDGRAIKATCKKLGIKHTYRAINEFLAGEDVK